MRSLFFDWIRPQSLKYYLLVSYAFELFGLIVTDTASDHLELAKKLLNGGKYSDALPHLHEAINNDPDSYLTYFKRATVFLALNRPNAALDDLHKALELNPKFISALVQRANLHLKLGNLDEAHIDYEQYINLEPAANNSNNSDDPALILNRIEWVKSEIMKAHDLMKDRQLDAALEVLSPVIELMPYSVDLLEVRARAYEKIGEIRRAINDYRTIARLKVDTATYLKIANLSYQSGEVEESLNSVRECLKLDPDHKSCIDFYRPTKKLNNHMKEMLSSEESRDNDDCFEQGTRALAYLAQWTPNQLPLVYSIQSVMCHCLSRAGDVKDGLSICSEALKNSHEGRLESFGVDKPDLLCDLADLLADEEQFEEALKLYKESLELAPSRRARDGVEKMKRMQKQKGRRDYYKILGVSRGADEEEINRAYRRLAAKWHPDRHPDAQAKKKAEAMFMDIADAKAVLTDPKKREQFDRGDDPLDPEARQQQNHQGFYREAFAHFGGGGPFSFKFDFDFD